MDPRLLAANLASLGLPGHLTRDPARALRELERAADGDPSDRALSRAILRVADRLAIEEAAPPRIGGVRVDRLVRWSSHSMLWTGTAIETGASTLIRVLRPEPAREPAFRRQLLRDGRALGGLVPLAADEETPSLRVELGGLAASARRGDALARPLLTGLAAIGAWERAGLGLPELCADELRLLDDGTVTIACLWPVEATAADGIRSLVGHLLDPEDDSALASAAQAIGAHPPASVEEAARTVRSALAQDLAARRHSLAGRWQRTWHQGRESRLCEAIDRLHRSIPPPCGRGAVGVDLDGRITVVEGDPDGVRWGPDLEMETVFDRTSGFRPAVARRLLQARAVSPPNPTLDARVSGDPAFTDAICRWVAAGLKLRTVRLLLDRGQG